MNPDPEIRRLLDLMPASGRMLTRLVSKPEQPSAIAAPFPVPWKPYRPIYINFDLWQRLSRPERDLLLLQVVSWVCGVRWFKPDIYQGLTLAGLVGTASEVLQGDAVGIVTAGSLSAIAAWQVWRNNRQLQLQLEADETALRVAERRGYSKVDAATHLLSAIETAAAIEGRPSLSFIELVRSQNLRAIANLSPVGIPETLRQQR
ncbi:DUF3318 domain-containing protein [Geitlerinema splendidum]|nr:DUF3318 domain-containing protein [Geitlerinema splendidum]